MNGFDAFQVQSLKHASPFSPGAASAAANAPAACLPLVENFHHDQVMTSETLGPPIKLACIVVGLGQADLVEQNRALQAMGVMGVMGAMGAMGPMALRGCPKFTGSGCIPGAKEST